MTTEPGRVPNPVTAPPAGAPAVTYHQAPNGAPMAYAPQVVYIPEQRKRVNHLLHLILTLCTGGLWLIVWIPLAFAKS